jgi:hypothetical protein
MLGLRTLGGPERLALIAQSDVPIHALTDDHGLEGSRHQQAPMSPLHSAPMSPLVSPYHDGLGSSMKSTEFGRIQFCAERN